MNMFRLGLPVLVVLMTVANLTMAIYNGNSAAGWANFTAFCGWLIVSIDNIQDFYRNKIL